MASSLRQAVSWLGSVGGFAFGADVGASYRKGPGASNQSQDFAAIENIFFDKVTPATRGTVTKCPKNKCERILLMEKQHSQFINCCIHARSATGGKLPLGVPAGTDIVIGEVTVCPHRAT
jgi:hypothetical protein